MVNAPGVRAVPSRRAFVSGPQSATVEDLTDRLGISASVAAKAMAAPTNRAYRSRRGAESSGEARCSTWPPASLSTTFETSTASPNTPPTTTSTKTNRSSRRWNGRPPKCSSPTSRTTRNCAGVIEGGDFSAWRIFLHPEQRKYVDHDFNGPFRLSGGAGTGKTVVAIHRARRLWRANPRRADHPHHLQRDPGTGLRNRPDGVGSQPADRRHTRRSGCSSAASTRWERDSRPRVAGRHRHRMFSCIPGATRLNSAPSGRHAGGGRGRPERRIGPRPPNWRRCRSLRAVRGRGPGESDHHARAVPKLPALAAEFGWAARSAPCRVKLVDAYRRQSQMDETISFPEVLAMAAEALRSRAARGGATPPTMSSSTRRKTCTPRTGRCCGRWPPTVPTTCSSPRTPISDLRKPIVLSRFGIKIVGKSRRLTLNYQHHSTESLPPSASSPEPTTPTSRTRREPPANTGPAQQRPGTGTHSLSESQAAELDTVAENQVMARRR